MTGIMGKWPSAHGQPTKIRLPDGCKRDAVHLAVDQWCDFHEFGCHLGNDGSNWESQLWPFVRVMAEGDLVVMPLKHRSAIAIGRIAGPYAFRTDLGDARSNPTRLSITGKCLTEMFGKFTISGQSPCYHFDKWKLLDFKSKELSPPV